MDSHNSHTLRDRTTATWVPPKGHLVSLALPCHSGSLSSLDTKTQASFPGLQYYLTEDSPGRILAGLVLASLKTTPSVFATLPFPKGTGALTYLPGPGISPSLTLSTVPSELFPQVLSFFQKGQPQRTGHSSPEGFPNPIPIPSQVSPSSLLRLSPQSWQLLKGSWPPAFPPT